MPIFSNTLTDGRHTNIWDSQNRLVSLIKAGKMCDFRYGITDPGEDSNEYDLCYFGMIGARADAFPHAR